MAIDRGRTRIEWSDISKAARDTSEALVGKDWTRASIQARVLLADLADEIDRIRAERDRLKTVARSVVNLYRDSDMRPEAECNELYIQALDALGELGDARR